MKWPYQCEKCGAALDAGEHCDCESSRNDERRQRDNETETRAKKDGRLPVMR